MAFAPAGAVIPGQRASVSAPVFCPSLPGHGHGYPTRCGRRDELMDQLGQHLVQSRLAQLTLLVERLMRSSDRYHLGQHPRHQLELEGIAKGDEAPVAATC